MVGGVNFYSRKEIKDILAYLKTIDNGRDDLQVRRIVNVPKRGIGAVTVARVQAFADENGFSFYDALKGAGRIPGLGKAARNLEAFYDMMQGFREKKDSCGLKNLVDGILEDTGYLQEIREQEDAAEANERISNLDEFISKVVAYEASVDDPTLEGFLAEVALVADIDDVESEGNQVLLMTLHGAKGLEFPQVYLSGMEDGLFPSSMSILGDDPLEIEEERRLAYVGITRAKRELTLTCARQRMLRGETKRSRVSRFVREIPPRLLDGYLPAPEGAPDGAPAFEEGDGFAFGGGEGEDGSVSPWRGRSQQIQQSQKRPVARVKAVPRPRQAPEEKRPYVVKGVKTLDDIAGLQKGSIKAPALEFQVGDRVSHVKYGSGTVLDIEDEPRDYRVTVLFDTAGQKKMYAAFAKLKKL